MEDARAAASNRRGSLVWLSTYRQTCMYVCACVSVCMWHADRQRLADWRQQCPQSRTLWRAGCQPGKERAERPHRTEPNRTVAGAIGLVYQGLWPVPGLGMGHSHFGSQSYNLMLRHLPYIVYGLFAADITTMWGSLLRLGYRKKWYNNLILYYEWIKGDNI